MYGLLQVELKRLFTSGVYGPQESTVYMNRCTGCAPGVDRPHRGGFPADLTAVTEPVSSPARAFFGR